ncbi:MAG: GtrA family protein [Myxococcales bacterium]|nr:GtrA family protein [Myxococcales bacterium]
MSKVKAKSALVGVVATLADLAMLALLVEVIGIAPRLASAPALLLGVLVQFLGNKVFAFEDRSRAWARQGLLFGLVEIGALALNALLFDRLVALTGIPYLPARLLVGGTVYFGFSLPLWSRIFRPQPVVSSC